MWELRIQNLEQGAQPIALCEASMIPVTALAWAEAFGDTATGFAVADQAMGRRR